jgi:hypothetical protein
MRQSTIEISRCKAIAAHGRRCMQTPYMTSPFCWHHTARADREALRSAGLRGGDQSKELAERIVGADLTPDQVQRIEQVLSGEEVAA